MVRAMPKQPTRRTPEDLRREADELERQAKAKRALADLMQEHGQYVADLIDVAVAESRRLPSRSQLGTPLDMSIQAQTVPLKRPGRKTITDGPVARAAKRAKVRMVDIAERMGVDYNVVKAWNRRGNVPERYRDAFEAACKPAKT